MVRVILIFLICGIACNGQQIKQYGVYLTAEDFCQKLLTSGFDTGEGTWEDTERKVLILSADSVKVEYDVRKIWGFRKEGMDWRVHGGSCYKISYRSNEIIIYTLPGYIRYDQPIVYDERYFSASASAELFELTRRNLKKVYGSNRYFLEKLERHAFAVSQWNPLCRCFPVVKLIE